MSFETMVPAIAVIITLIAQTSFFAYKFGAIVQTLANLDDRLRGVERREEKHRHLIRENENRIQTLEVLNENQKDG